MTWNHRYTLIETASQKNFNIQLITQFLFGKKTFFHECQFEIVFEAKFKFEDIFFVNYEDNILLEPTERSNQCNMSLLKTNQGLYIANSKKLNKIVQKGKMNLEIIRDLMISNIDLNKNEDLRWINLLKDQECFNFKLKYGVIYIPEC
ncbi:hypothetical protein BpHYR1_003808 [Brachionus plicatilis]|uniref:Uncharacterized protein n=1 Tax=Brachionus plicatilis TaxID=10195 RepID=A0A3M7PRY3_BRAPC|nr:hypothetical protein BpHYR1_003808 [Brachionus plicatilis]